MINLRVQLTGMIFFVSVFQTGLIITSHHIFRIIEVCCSTFFLAIITKHAKNMFPDRFHMELNSKGALDGPVYIILSGLDDNYLEPLNRHVLS